MSIKIENLGLSIEQQRLEWIRRAKDAAEKIAVCFTFDSVLRHDGLPGSLAEARRLWAEADAHIEAWEMSFPRNQMIAAHRGKERA